MAEASLLASRLAPRLQVRTQLTPARHITRPQDQALLRAQPGRQTRDHPRRAQHHQSGRGPTPATGAALVIAMTPEGVLQIVVRPRQVRRFVALEQAGPIAL